MKFLLLSLSFALTSTCCAQKIYKLKEAPDSTYGYTMEHPVPLKAGDPQVSVSLSYRFISQLRTANNEKVRIYRRGSTMGKRYQMIDIYTLVSESGSDTIRLYVNIYKRGKLYIPKGLKMETAE
jgi:hypothetical protein